MDTRNQEQLFDREKLMMSCPESSAGSPTPWGLSLNNRMSAAAGASVWGRHLSIISEAAREQVGRPIREGPSTAGPGPGSEAPSGVRTSCEWATETKWWHAGGKLVICAAGYNKGIWIHAAYHTNSVVDSGSQMVLIKDVHRQPFLSYRGRRPVCVYV